MNANTYMQALLWCCNSCGFTFAGKQPHMECPICEAYKTSFIDIPQHIEMAIREKHGVKGSEAGANTAEARAERLELLRGDGFLKSFRMKGRKTKAVHQAEASRDYTPDE